MKWRYKANDTYVYRTHRIIVSHTPDFDENLRLENTNVIVKVPWGKHKYGLHVISNYIRNNVVNKL